MDLLRFNWHFPGKLLVSRKVEITFSFFLFLSTRNRTCPIARIQRLAKKIPVIPFIAKFGSTNNALGPAVKVAKWPNCNEKGSKRQVEERTNFNFSSQPHNFFTSQIHCINFDPGGCLRFMGLKVVYGVKFFKFMTHCKGLRW